MVKKIALTMVRFFSYILAENQGFEPWQDLHPLAVFETAPFSRLGISPWVYYSIFPVQARYDNFILRIIGF